MATFKSDLITNQDARPSVKSASGILSGERRIVSALSTLGAITTGDDLILAQLPATARIYAIRLACEAAWVGTTPDLNVTVYKRDVVPGTVGSFVYSAAVVAAYSLGLVTIPAYDPQQSNFAFVTGATNDGTDGRNIDRAGKTIWEDAFYANQSAAPADLYIGITVVAEGTAPVTLHSEIEYVQD